VDQTAKFDFDGPDRTVRIATRPQAMRIA
jgi:hypothetical protein